jgi:hypothetical protein
MDARKNPAPGAFEWRDPDLNVQLYSLSGKSGCSGSTRIA